MKSIFIALFLAFGVACEEHPSVATKVEAPDASRTVRGNDWEISYRIIRFEKCQYIILNIGITHKGDCDNPIHCRQVENPK